MPTQWENLYVDRLQTLSDRRKIPDVVEEVRGAVERLILPDAAKVLTAIAADLIAAIETRNNRQDVNDAHGALRNALALLEAINGKLDG